MPSLGISKRKYGQIPQHHHMPGELLEVERLEKVMNLEPISLGLPAEPKNVQEAFRLATKGVSRI